jgi:hypothetical protein
MYQTYDDIDGIAVSISTQLNCSSLGSSQLFPRLKNLYFARLNAQQKKKKVCATGFQSSLRQALCQVSGKTQLLEIC